MKTWRLQARKASGLSVASWKIARTRADRPVLVVPGRLAHRPQERVDDRRHPQAPPEDLDHVLGELDHARPS